MSVVSVLKYAVLIVVLELCTVALAGLPKDSVKRVGIVKKLYTETECNDFKDEVSIDGVIYVKSGEQREKEIEEGRYLAIIQRYEQYTTPNNGFDFTVLIVLSGTEAGSFVTGLQLIKLQEDADLDDAIIQMTQPPGLEFVMVDKQCAFIRNGNSAVNKVYDCGNDNYEAYPCV